MNAKIQTPISTSAWGYLLDSEHSYLGLREEMKFTHQWSTNSQKPGQYAEAPCP